MAGKRVKSLRKCTEKQLRADSFSIAAILFIFNHDGITRSQVLVERFFLVWNMCFFLYVCQSRAFPLVDCADGEDHVERSDYNIRSVDR